MSPKDPHVEALVLKVVLLGDGASGLQDGVNLNGDCGIPVPSSSQFIPAMRGGISPPHIEQVCCYRHGKPSMVLRTCYIRRRWENCIDNGGISPLSWYFFHNFYLEKKLSFKETVCHGRGQVTFVSSFLSPVGLNIFLFLEPHLAGIASPLTETGHRPCQLCHGAAGHFKFPDRGGC